MKEIRAQVPDDVVAAARYVGTLLGCPPKTVYCKVLSGVLELFGLEGFEKLTKNIALPGVGSVGDWKQEPDPAKD